MSTKIVEHKSLLAHISVAQNVQFHSSVIGQIERYVSDISGLALAFSGYKTAFGTLNSAFNDSNKAIETNDLIKLGERRDATVNQLGERIGYHYKFPLNAAEIEAAKALQLTFETYRKASRIDHEAKTVSARSLIAELRSQPEYVTLLEFNALIDRLELINNAFEEVYTIRANSKEAKRERGSVTELTRKTNASFDVLCQVVAGMLHMPLDTVTKTNLADTVSVVNALIRQYTIIYNHHASVVLARKKGNVNAEINIV